MLFNTTFFRHLTECMCAYVDLTYDDAANVLDPLLGGRERLGNTFIAQCRCAPLIVKRCEVRPKNYCEGSLKNVYATKGITNLSMRQKILACLVFLSLVYITSIRIKTEETPIWWQEYVVMRDGVCLNTKIFLPDPYVWGSGPYPAIVTRTPYGIGEPDAIPNGGLPEEPPHGYACVMQDMRGRFFSEGVDRMFYDEGKDGYDTIEWVASQPWCNGKVGLYGVSAGGISTYLAAGERPPHLVAAYAIVASANLYNDLIFDGGAFRMADTMMWVLGRIEGLSEAHLRTVVPQPQWESIPKYQTDCHDILANMGNHKDVNYPYRPVDSEWYMHLPLKGFNNSFSILQPWLDEILSHPNEDEFRNHLSVIDKIEVPMIHVGGWYDFLAGSTIDAFVKLQQMENQRLIMMPGTHSDLGQYPYASFYRWFDYWLKGIDTGIMNEPRVTYYCLGTDEWKTAGEWIPEGGNYVQGYLHSNGLLNTDPCASEEAPDTYVYNPINPVLTHGGRNLILPSGAFDQRPVEEGRTDILIYRSGMLKENLETTGAIKIVLSVSSNCTDTDFTAKLIDVYPNGSGILVLDNIIRARYRGSAQEPVFMQPSEIYQITIDLGDIAYVFEAGHRVQLDISSSNFPKYDRNLNTGGTLYNETEFNIAENVIYHDSAHPSYVLFPTLSHEPNPLLGDLDNNGVVDITDVFIVANAFGSTPEHSRWNPIADLNNDDAINIRDLYVVAHEYGKTA